MSKLKSPLLSLGAKGTIADTLTYQERQGYTFAREKPIPAYRRTLPQLYQRWLYEDYAYLWTLQSEATRREYAAAGSRHHLTGFQYWMKYNLTNLPDIDALWHLDEKSGAIAYDSSRNLNHGTYIGTTPITGAIDGAHYFDGLNDLVQFALTPSLKNVGDITIELFTKMVGAATMRFVSSGLFIREGFEIFVRANGQLGYRTNQLGVSQETKTAVGALLPDILYHIAIVRAGNTAHIFLNGVDRTSVHAVHIDPLPPVWPLILGCDLTKAVHWLKGFLDHVILYNRTLILPEIVRHSLRRYPS